MTRHGSDGSTILLFGPQALSFQEESFHQLKSIILAEAENGWILDAIAELPAYMKLFSDRFPKLQAIPGVDLLEALNDWFKADKNSPLSSQLPNILLSPLVVLSQLTQYSKYVRLTHPAPGHKQTPYTSHSQKTETVGFCTGLLSALAVSSAADQAQFQRYGAVAIRLATLIGAFVDAQDVLGKHGESKSFATVWNSYESSIEMSRILQQFPEVQTLSPVLARAQLTDLAGVRFGLLRQKSSNHDNLR